MVSSSTKQAAIDWQKEYMHTVKTSVVMTCIDLYSQAFQMAHGRYAELKTNFGQLAHISYVFPPALLFVYKYSWTKHVYIIFG